MAALIAACIPALGLIWLAQRYHLELRASLRNALTRRAISTVDRAKLTSADFRAVVLVGDVASPRLNELSGLAASHRRSDLLFAVNDSGDGPWIYALGTDGADLGVIGVEGAVNIDWEDMASFELDGEPYLLVADVGDNFAWRPAITLYIVPEPLLDGARFAANATVKPRFVLRVRYPDGPRDCEAVAVDAAARRILLLSKRTVPPVLYSVPLAPRHDDPRAVPASLVAERLTAVPIPPPSTADFALLETAHGSARPTAMDISPDRLHAVVVTYRDGYRFDRNPGESWARAFARLPAHFAVPPLRALEAVAFARDGRSLYVSSELRPAPLYRFDP